MKRILILALALAPLAALAGVNTSAMAIAGDSLKQPPAASLVQRADYICAVVVIRNSNRELDRQTAAVQQSVTALRKAAERSNRFQIHDGTVQSTATLAQPGLNSGVLQAVVRILCPLGSSTATDMIENVRQLRQFIASVDTTGGAALEIASINLTVESPEQYREKLMSLIADQTRLAQQTLDARSITVDGLGSGISVRQIDELNVEIYIDHQISAAVGRY